MGTVSTRALEAGVTLRSEWLKLSEQEGEKQLGEGPRDRDGVEDGG